MLTAVDAVAVLLLMFALPLYLHYVDFPRTRADVLSGRPNARRDTFRRTILQQWSITALVVLGWASAGRVWPDLRFAWPSGFGLGLTIGATVAGVALATMQAVAVARTPGAIPAIRKQFAELEWLLPHTKTESAWFRVLSVTAGICEEVVFRGYLLWGLDQVLPLPGAVVLQAIVFGVCHSYQGKTGIVKTGIVGLVMGALAAATGSLLGPIVIHAAVDLGAGSIALRVFGDDDARDQETARAAHSIK